MNWKVISRNIGCALLVSALFMFFSIIISVSEGNDSALAALIISFTITFIVGIFPFIFVRKTDVISLKEGYVIITLSWLMSFVFGLLPYALWGGPFTLQNALFESVSGYTTCGATILDKVEALPRSLLFWRASTHFIGGLGVVVFLLLIKDILNICTNAFIHVFMINQLIKFNDKHIAALNQHFSNMRITIIHHHFGFCHGLQKCRF